MNDWPEFVAGQRDRIRWMLANLVPASQVEDLAHDTLVRALEHPPALMTNPRAWVATIGRRVAADWWRDTRRRWDELPDQHDPRSFNDQLEHRDDLVRRLGALEPRQRQALWMTGAGFTHNEIADAIDCDERAVKHIVFGARRVSESVPGGGESRHRGVEWNPARRKWRARLKVDGRFYHLGYFTDELAAARAAAEARGTRRDATPQEVSTLDRIRAVRSAHPEWTQRQIATSLGISSGTVFKALARDRDRRKVTEALRGAA